MATEEEASREINMRSSLENMSASPLIFCVALLPHAGQRGPKSQNSSIDRWENLNLRFRAISRGIEGGICGQAAITVD